MAMADDHEDIDLDNPPFPLTEKDRKQLSTRDEDFHRLTWTDLRTIIGTANDIDDWDVSQRS